MNECCVCSSANSKPLYQEIAKCQGCGHIFADVDLCNENIAEIYNKGYFFGNEYSNYLQDEKVLKKNFRLRLKVLENFRDKDHHKHLLEIGSAYGFFLNMVKDQYESVLGIDISKEAAQYARDKLKLDAINGDFLSHDFNTKKFDVVCMWDTVEHLMSPQLYLKKINSLIKSGALLAITTGDIQSLNARFRKNKWRMIHPPSHIHYFSRETLGKLLNDNGFDIIYDRYCGFYRSVDNIAYRTMVLNKKLPGLYNFLQKLGLTKLNIYLNLYDIRYIVARKR